LNDIAMPESMTLLREEDEAWTVRPLQAGAGGLGQVPENSAR